MSRYLLPRLRDFLFIVLFTGALVSGTRMLNADSDLGRHLTIGNYILQSGNIPTHDILSFTRAGASRPPYEWLAQVLFAASYRLLDLDGVVLLSALVIAAAFTAIYHDAVRRSGAPLLALGMVAWAAIASSLHWLSRPHIFSFLFFALWLAFLDRVRQRMQQPLWYFPILMLLWVNTHGGFIFGFLAYTAYLAGWMLDYWRKSADLHVGRSLFIIGATSLAATVVTPDLWRNWNAVLGNHSAYVLSQTVETSPIELAQPNVWPFLAFVAIAALLIVLLRKQIAAAHVLLLAGLAFASFVMIRNIPFFVLAAAPLCTEWLSIWLPKFGPGFRLERRLEDIDRLLHGFIWSALVVALAVGLIAYHHVRTQTGIFHLNPPGYPVAAVDWLARNSPQGHMFNDFNWGGYLLFKMWPEQKVFIDSQSDFYGESFIREYVSILDGDQGWELRLDQLKVNWILIPLSAPLADQVRKDPAWRQAYQDDISVIFIRK